MRVVKSRRSLFAAAVLAVAALLFPVLVSAQVGGGNEAGSGANFDGLEESLSSTAGQWKKNYASPSVGVVLYKVRVHFNSTPEVTFNLPYNEKEYTVPALDVRIFRGINITKRAGFFSGIEAGAAVFLPYEESIYADVTVIDNTPPYDPSPEYNNIVDSGIDTFNVALYGGTVFLMLTYGYRFEVGFPKLGFSAGFQLGTGASIFSGGYDVYAGSRDDPIAKGGYGTKEVRFDLATGFSLEAAIRLGRNFRVFSAAGLLMTPFQIDDKNRTNIPGSEVLTDPAPTNRRYLKYALNHYDVEVDGFGFSLRAGFILNFN